MISNLKITHFYSWNARGEDTFRDLFTLLGCPFWNLNANLLSLSKILIFAGSTFALGCDPTAGLWAFPAGTGREDFKSFLIPFEEQKIDGVESPNTSVFAAPSLERVWLDWDTWVRSADTALNKFPLLHHRTKGEISTDKEKSENELKPAALIGLETQMHVQL